MFLITCERFNLNATTSDSAMACYLADAVLELIGDETGGHVLITDGHTAKAEIVYLGDQYIIDGDVYDSFYDACDSLRYRIN